MMVGLGQATASGSLEEETGAATGTATVGLPLCANIVTPAGFVGPINCDPSAGPVQYTPATQPTGETATTTKSWGSTLLIAASIIGALLIISQETRR